MSECAVCGCKRSRTDLVDEVFHVDGAYVLVEHIPARICTRCGEEYISLETVEAVRLAVQGGATPYRSIQMRVFEFEATEDVRAKDTVIS